MEPEVAYDYGWWSATIVNVLLFGGFVLGFLAPTRRHEWRSLGVFLAFIVALFTEMYGFPLTIYLLTSLLGGILPLTDPFRHLNGHLWVSLFGGPDWLKQVVCQIGSVAMLGGLILMGIGWRLIHRAQGGLTTRSVYGSMRHPQYSGLFLITTGMLIQWPTLSTVLMWPVLMVAYYRLARREEAVLVARFGDAYRQYMAHVPAFIPHRRPWRSPQPEAHDEPFPASGISPLDTGEVSAQDPAVRHALASRLPEV
jgi:protein-S-isoprenylcysteine O-methyltransferase Ste14